MPFWWKVACQMEQIFFFLVRILSAKVDLILPQLCSNSVRPGRCLSASSFTEKANLAWNLKGRKPWLKIEVFVTGRGHRNGKILPIHLPGCQRSSSLPLGTLAVQSLPRTACRLRRQRGRWTRPLRSDRDLFAAIGAVPTTTTTGSPFLQPSDGGASAGVTGAVEGFINLTAPSLKLLSPQQHQQSRAVVSPQTLQLRAWSITPNHRWGCLKIKYRVAEKLTCFCSLWSLLWGSGLWHTGRTNVAGETQGSTWKGCS